MSTPVAGTDPTLFKEYLADKVRSQRTVCLQFATPHGAGCVAGTLHLTDEGEYIVRSGDRMSHALFSLNDVRALGDICIWLKF